MGDEPDRDQRVARGPSGTGRIALSGQADHLAVRHTLRQGEGDGLPGRQSHAGLLARGYVLQGDRDLRPHVAAGRASRTAAAAGARGAEYGTQDVVVAA